MTSFEITLFRGNPIFCSPRWSPDAKEAAEIGTKLTEELRAAASAASVG